MSRSWKDIKADKQAIDEAAGRDVEASRERARARTQSYVLGNRLAGLRERAGLSQSALAERMGISQVRVSAIERGASLEPMEVATIRRYITALGGQMRVVADFDDHDITVSSVEVDRGDDLANAR
ncbi:MULTISPECIES: helix-turn-helix transcriptional regulator [unclassified Saccharopolyspora]|uniref:helix-turn-helix transcriptional regulator n=1 Tax=Saccharopolyspora TaxID=1835 RepID=UPI00190D1158|nr:helix-turn-helix transcriptional regulator [Saccharopolyspora sp. HNM0986]MBK0867408.1 helix-turn-helix transcriptional regulator [Saccharopolyspora sp. HNM0986]